MSKFFKYAIKKELSTKICQQLNFTPLYSTHRNMSRKKILLQFKLNRNYASVLLEL